MNKESLLDFKFSEVADERGQSFIQFRKQLRPSYAVIWLQIAASYLFIATVVLFNFWFVADSIFNILLRSLASGLLIGYAMAFLTLFLHEASHYGLCKAKDLNDKLGSLLIGYLVGESTQKYRKHHLLHHSNLGKTNDPEHSYFSPLNIRTIFESLFMIAAFRKVFGTKTESKKEQRGPDWVLLSGALFHLGILGIFIYLENWVNWLAWGMAMGMFFPFFAWLRQLLEHRSPQASASLDYSKVDHGSFSRIFKGGFLTKTFGGAGFDRHLLHHWDASISCTNLAAVEKFLLSSNAKDVVAAAYSTYLRTFFQLIRAR